MTRHILRIAESVSSVRTESTHGLNAFPTVIRFCWRVFAFKHEFNCENNTHNTDKYKKKNINIYQEMRDVQVEKNKTKNCSVPYWSRDLSRLSHDCASLNHRFEHGRQRGAPESLRWRWWGWRRWGVSAPEPAVWPEAPAPPDPGAALHVLSGLR